jgi:hypothetical protein
MLLNNTSLSTAWAITTLKRLACYCTTVDVNHNAALAVIYTNNSHSSCSLGGLMY